MVEIGRKLSDRFGHQLFHGHAILFDFHFARDSTVESSGDSCLRMATKHLIVLITLALRHIQLSPTAVSAVRHETPPLRYSDVSSKRGKMSCWHFTMAIGQFRMSEPCHWLPSLQIVLFILVSVSEKSRMFLTGCRIWKPEATKVSITMPRCLFDAVCNSHVHFCIRMWLRSMVAPLCRLINQKALSTACKVRLSPR